MIKDIFRHLWLAVSLILVASASLLISDLGKRTAGRSAPSFATSSSSTVPGPVAGKKYTVALSYFAPADVFEESIRGLKNGFAAGGYVEGENLTLVAQHCNADMGLLTQVT